MTPCQGETSEVRTQWGVLKLFIVRRVVLNLTMIELVDLPLYGENWKGILVKNKMNCQRCNINVTIIDFLGTWVACC